MVWKRRFICNNLRDEVKGKENLVRRLKKSLYMLKQAPTQWYLKFESFMLKNGFARCNTNHCVYLQRYENADFLILTLYIDDIIVADSSMKKINDLKSWHESFL